MLLAQVKVIYDTAGMTETYLEVLLCESVLQDKNSKHRSYGRCKAAVDGRALEPT